MAGVSFSELILLFVIGLLILGPERLPRVANQIGRWVGRARRTANQLRYQLEREIALSDIEANKKKKPPEKPSSQAADSKEPPVDSGHDQPGQDGSDNRPADATGTSSDGAGTAPTATGSITETPAAAEPQPGRDRSEQA